MTETAANFTNLEMPTITDLGTDRPKTDAEMTCLHKTNTDEAIHQKLRKKKPYFCGFNNLPIPSAYSDPTNDYYEYGTQIDASVVDEKGMEYEACKIDEKTMMTSSIYTLTPTQTKFWRLREWTE